MIEVIQRNEQGLAVNFERSLTGKLPSAMAPFEELPVSDQAKEEVAQLMAEGPVAEGLDQIRSYDVATFQHVVGVGLLAVDLAIASDVAKPLRSQLAQGALLHDLGKVDVDPDIVHSASGLSPEERRKIEEHPRYGFLRAVELYTADGQPIHPEAPRRVANLVLTHHCHNESPGYSAYPSFEEVGRMQEAGVVSFAELQDPELQQLGGLLGIADVYEAITANRSYNRDRFKNPLKVLEALCETHGSLDAQVDHLLGIHLERFEDHGWMPDTVIALQDLAHA